MKSIRRQLTTSLCLAAAILLPVGGVLVYFTARQVLLAQFDETLAAKADALVTAAEVDDGEFEIDFDVQSFAGFGSPYGGDFFEIRMPSGRLLAHSPSLADQQLNFTERTSRGEWKGWITLPEGRPGRGLAQRFSPSGDGAEAYAQLSLIVASDATGLRHTLRLLAAVLLASGAVGLITALLTLRAALRHGLAPLETLSAEVDRLQLDQPGLRLAAVPLPDELNIIATKLNALLERVEASIARERRFTSHAAHELRTPLAELKSMAELIQQWPDEATPEHTASMLGTVEELEALIEKLLTLARAENGTLHVHREPIDVKASIDSWLARHRAEIEARGLQMCVQSGPEPLQLDPILWQAILGNVLGNALAYAPPGSPIEIESDHRTFSVANAAPNLTPADLPFLFDRFWRKDTSRAGSGHAGIGLSLVHACAKLLGGECTGTLTTDGRLRIVITLAASEKPLANSDPGGQSAGRSSSPT